MNVEESVHVVYDEVDRKSIQIPKNSAKEDEQNISLEKQPVVLSKQPIVLYLGVFRKVENCF